MTAALFVSAVVLCFGALKMGNIYGFLLLPDEYAYWSYAAWAAGYDWSDITSLGSYFSYGYAILLFPIFKLCKDAVVAYRAAVWCNYILLIVAYMVLNRMIRKMIPDEKTPVELFAACTILVPWNLFYAQTTMTETLLVFLYVASGYLLLRYLETDRTSVLCLLLLTLAYTYTVHMRTIGILLSALTVLTIHILWRGKRRHLPLIFGITALALLAAAYVKNYSLEYVYGGISPALAADNDYSGQLAKIRYICTGEGFRDLAVTVLGGIMYLGLATFGLFYWGIYALLRDVLHLLRDPAGRWTARKEMSLFLFLTVAAQIMIASIYLLQRGEVDDYTYGRYSELIVPCVMTVGFAALWRARTRRILTVSVLAALLHIGVILLVVRQIAYTGSEQYMGYFMVGISYLYRAASYTVGRFYGGAYLICELLTACAVILIVLCRSRAGRRYLLLTAAVVELALAVHADNLYLTPFKNAAFRDTRVADKLFMLDDGDRDIVYMDDGERAYIGILQFMARDMDIRIMESREKPGDYHGELSPADILIFAYDDPNAQGWMDAYSHGDPYGHFTLLYND